MLATAIASNITAPNQFLEVANQRYAYRRFGEGAGLPLRFSPALYGYARQLGPRSD